MGSGDDNDEDIETDFNLKTMYEVQHILPQSGRSGGLGKERRRGELLQCQGCDAG